MMRPIDLKRGISIEHGRYGRGVTVKDPERNLLDRLTGFIWTLFDQDLADTGNIPRLVHADHMTALVPTGLPLATAELLDFGNITPIPPQLPSPGARFGGRKIRGIEVITGGRP